MDTAPLRDAYRAQLNAQADAVRARRTDAQRDRTRHSGTGFAPVQRQSCGRPAVPLRGIITGLAEVELPGHTRQLLALLPKDSGHQAMT